MTGWRGALHVGQLPQRRPDRLEGLAVFLGKALSFASLLTVVIFDLSD